LVLTPTPIELKGRRMTLHPAVHMERLAGHVLRLFTGKKYGDATDIALWVADISNGNSGKRRLKILGVGQILVRNLGMRRWDDDVNPDLVFAPIPRRVTIPTRPVSAF
jgi:hypothetical protein